MNTLERMLQDELNRLLDRIAVRAGEDTTAGLKSGAIAPSGEHSSQGSTQQ